MGFLSDLVETAAPVAALGAGIYTGNPGLIAGGLGMLGSGAQAKQGAQAAQTAAQATQFRPVGITNTFGTSNFAFDPNTGQMTSAGYTLSPQLQAYQNAIQGSTQQSLGDVAALQNLGRGYLAQSPQQAAQSWMANQQALLTPSREKAWSDVANKNYNQGTTGLSVAQGGSLAAANPYASALANAQAQQDLQLAANAQQAGQQQVAFGQGLLNSAYQPFTAGLNTMGAVEGLGQQPLELSSSLAGRSATAGNNAAKYLASANSYSPLGSLLSSSSTNQLLGSGISGLFGGGVPSWTTGADVMPQSTFSGYGGNIENDLASWTSPNPFNAGAWGNG